MTTANRLDVLNKDIQVTGVKFTEVALIRDQLDEETLIHEWVFLQKVEGARSWWFGDHLVGYCEFRLAQEGDSLRSEAKADPAMRRRLFRRYTAERGDIAKVDIKTLHEWRDVAEFYTFADRSAELLNSHHADAMAASDGDKAVAAEWLDLAKKNKWTVPQLRAAIRKAQRAEVEPDEPMPEMTQSELFACARWSRTVIKRVPDMDRNEAEQLLADLQPIVALASQLAAKLAAETKESIAA